MAADSNSDARRARHRRHMALWAVLFPAFFFVVIALGIAAMYTKRMHFFKPPPSGRAAVPALTACGYRNVG